MKIAMAVTGPVDVNTYLVGDEETKKAFIVDPGGVDEQLDECAEAEGWTIEYIIITHGHGDHIGAVKHYKEKYGAKLVACVHEKEFLLDPSMNCSTMICGEPIALEADIYVDDEDTLDVGNMHLKFIFTPGHTPGGMCIYAENESVLFSGDTLFAQSIGRTDFPGGSFKELCSSVRNKLFALPEITDVLPGHMGATSIAKEKGSNPFV